MANSLMDIMNWASAAVAVIGILAYFGAILRPPRYVRLINGSGLMLCALGLGEVASFGNRAAASGFGFNTQLAEVFLIFSVLVQAWASMRRRKPWTGQERRTIAEAERRGKRSDRRAAERRETDRRSGEPDPSFDVADRRSGDRREDEERRTGPRRGSEPDKS